MSSAALGLVVLRALPEELRTHTIIRGVLLSDSDDLEVLAAIVDNGSPSVMAPGKLDAMATLTLAMSWDLLSNSNSPRVMRATLVAALPLMLDGFAQLSAAKQDAFVSAIVPAEKSCQELRDRAEYVLSPRPPATSSV